MALDDVLLAIGSFDRLRPEDEPDPDWITIVTPARTRRHIVQQIREEAVALKRDFGIELRKMADGREGVFYQKHPKVWFESPEKPIPPSFMVIEAQESETGQGAAMV